MAFLRVLCAVSVLLLLDGAVAQPDVCGKASLNTHTRIVGGQEAPVGFWPWQVSIHSGGRHFCGGSLINNQWVLSAAHCFYESDPSVSIDPTSYTVYIGRKSQQTSNPNEVSRGITQVINHPSYVPSIYNNDVALMKMASTVTFTTYISPVCLAEPGSTFYAGTNSWVTGWGAINSGVSLPHPQNLMEVDVPIVGNRKCQCDYEGTFTITENMLCAGLEEGGKDSCQGDSGGPMVSKQNGRWVQSGVVSFGKGCAVANQPGVYARVSKYKDWINSHITENQPGYITFSSSGTDSDLAVSCNSVPALTTTAPTASTTPKPVTCGEAPKNSRLSEGTPVTAGQWPWMASIQKNGSHMCGGTLVAVDTVLSDASCFPSPTNASEWSLVLGQTQLRAAGSVRVSVTDIIKSNISGSNVALLRLASRPTLSDNIQPICINTALSFSEGTTCYSAGWGQQGATGDLQEKQTTIQSCGNTSLSESICTPVFIIQQGDYGGPLMTQVSNAWYQIVVLSNSNSSSSTRASSVLTFDNIRNYQSFLGANLGTFLSPSSALNSTSNPTSNSTSTDSAPSTGCSMLCTLLLLSMLNLLLWG